MVSIHWTAVATGFPLFSSSNYLVLSGLDFFQSSTWLASLILFYFIP